MIINKARIWLLLGLCSLSLKCMATTEWQLNDATSSLLYNQTSISEQEEILSELKKKNTTESPDLILCMDAMLLIHKGRFDLAYPLVSKSKYHYILRQLVKLHLFTTAEITDSVEALVRNINNSNVVLPIGYIADFNHVTILRALLFLKQEQDVLNHLESVISQKWHSDQALIEFKLLEAHVHLQFNELEYPLFDKHAFPKKLEPVQKARVLEVQGLIHKANAQFHKAREYWTEAISLLEKPNYLYAQIKAYLWKLEFSSDSTMSFGQFPPGAPIIQHFYTSEHGGWPDNHTFSQDSQGRMYVGNSYGALVFDGERWELIEQTKSSAIVKLHSDSLGNIWTLGIRGLRAELRKNSTSPSLSTIFSLDTQLVVDRHRGYSTPFSLLSTQKGTFVGFGPFLAASLDASASYHVTDVRVHKVGNRLFKIYRGGGLWKHSEGKWKHLPHSCGIEALDVLGIFGGAGNELLIISKNGILKLSEYGIRPLKTTADAYLSKHKIVSAFMLKDRTLCIGTKGGGIAFFSQEGELMQIVDANLGLSNNHVRSIYQDFDGNVWVCTDSGIDLIEYPTVHTSYASQFGINRAVANLLEHNNTAYINLYGDSLLEAQPYIRQTLPLVNWYTLLFKPIPSISNEGWATVSLLGEQLVIGSKQNLFTVKNGQSSNVLTAPLATLFRSSGGDTLFSAGEYLLSVYVENEQWKVDTLSKLGNNIASYRVCQSQEALWFGTHAHGMGRYILSDNSPEIKYYGENEGLPTKKYYAYKFRKKVIAYCKDEEVMMVYNPLKDSFENIPPLDSTFVGLDNWADEMYFWSKKGNEIMVQDKCGKLLNCNGTITNWPPIVTNGQTNCSYLTSECQWWQGVHTGKEWGLAITNKAVFNDASMKLPPILTSIKATKGSSTTLAITDSNAMNISSDWSNLRFQFSYPISEVDESMLYSVRLIGKHSKWDDWDASNSRNYSLYPGVYQFQVRAKNLNGQPSPVLIFKFRIETPWHSTILAKIGYTLALVILIILGIKLNGQRLQKQQVVLKKLVNERTAYIEEQKSQLMHKNRRIEALMQDTVHRAMGHMQLTKNLLEMQSRRMKDRAAKNALDETKKRITTLEQLQRMLLEIGVGNKRLSTKQLLQDISLRLKKAYRPNDELFELQMDIQDLSILPEYASSLGLLVSEIQMNAYKYAFSNTTRGLLRMKLIETGDTWKLEISDNGPGIQNEIKSHKTFGQQLISLFIQQLQGTLTISTQRGTTFKMVFPRLT